MADYTRFSRALWAPWDPCCTLFDLECGRPVGPGDSMLFLHQEDEYVALTGPGYGVVIVDVSRCRCQEADDLPLLPPGRTVAAC